MVTESQNVFGSAEHLQDRVPSTPCVPLPRAAQPHRASPPEPGIGRGAGKRPASEKTRRELARVANALGRAVRDERCRRGLRLRDVARVADVALATVHAAESGVVCSLETYLRLAGALSLRAEFDLADPHRREPSTRRAQDPVHAAMGEVEASHLRAIGFRVGIDEPFQHYQFAGRADVVAWSVECEALLHVENRTRFPDI